MFSGSGWRCHCGKSHFRRPKCKHQFRHRNLGPFRPTAFELTKSTDGVFREQRWRTFQTNFNRYNRPVSIKYDLIIYLTHGWAKYGQSPHIYWWYFFFITSSKLPADSPTVPPWESRESAFGWVRSCLTHRRWFRNDFPIMKRCKTRGIWDPD